MWFAASLFYRSSHDGQTSSEDLWEESIVLVDAIDEEQAELRAAEVAQASFAYKTNEGSELKWSFDSVDRVFAIDADKLTHGVELFSRYLRGSEITSLKTPFSDVSS